jgi:hypothetical protein
MFRRITQEFVMRRPINWITVSLALLFLVFGLSLSGCGSGGSGAAGGDDPPAVSGMLRQVRSASELETSLKASLQAAVANGLPAGPVATPSIDVTAFSNTNTVEAGVDEFDFVRYDGTHLFIAPSHASPDAIRILRTNASTGIATEASTIPLPSGEWVQGLYLANGRLLVLSSEAFFMPFGPLWMSVLLWAPTDMTIRVYDVSDAAHPRLVFEAEMDGVYVASRRIDDRVYLVSRHTPEVLADPAQRTTLASRSLDELLPQVRTAGQQRSAVTPTRCYIANDATRAGYPVITTITMLSLQNPDAFSSTCYNEPADGVYASRAALYVSQPRAESSGATFTRIHKFALANAGPEYAGSVEVAGQVWSGGQSDFRMSEHDGLLRVFTSTWTADSSDSVDHRLFVLRQKAAEPALEIVGRLPNDLRPAEIGKPNENLFGVRFIGDRAYGVTFQRVDPLYVFDLSNPADPRIAGELELPGVSDYLHPVSEQLLLGLGSNAGEVKLELFDVSMPGQPQSRGAVRLGPSEGRVAYSEAIHDHHAFTYLVGDDDRLAVPLSTYPVFQSGATGSEDALSLYEVRGKQNPATAELRSAGAVVPLEESLGGYRRSFIANDAVWYVRSGYVWSASWADPGQVRGPF